MVIPVEQSKDWTLWSHWRSACPAAAVGWQSPTNAGYRPNKDPLFCSLWCHNTSPPVCSFLLLLSIGESWSHLPSCRVFFVSSMVHYFYYLHHSILVHSQKYSHLASLEMELEVVLLKLGPSVVSMDDKVYYFYAAAAHSLRSSRVRGGPWMIQCLF